MQKKSPTETDGDVGCCTCRLASISPSRLPHTIGPVYDVFTDLLVPKSALYIGKFYSRPTGDINALAGREPVLIITCSLSCLGRTGKEDYYKVTDEGDNNVG